MQISTNVLIGVELSINGYMLVAPEVTHLPGDQTVVFKLLFC